MKKYYLELRKKLIKAIEKNDLKLAESLQFEIENLIIDYSITALVCSE